MNVDINKKVAGIKLYELEKKPVEKLAAISKIAATDGAVLLKNEDNLLPLKKGTKVSVFGRIQSTYYKSGTGSGGMVNVNHVSDIREGLNDCPDITLDAELMDIYDKWDEENPIDAGLGWGKEAWSQAEMPVSEELAGTLASRNDIAVLDWVKYPVAMGNACDEAKQCADYITTDVDDDGIWNALKHFELI